MWKQAAVHARCSAGFTVFVVFGSATPLICTVMEDTPGSSPAFAWHCGRGSLTQFKRGLSQGFDMPGASTHDRIPSHLKGLPYHVVVIEITVLSLGCRVTSWSWVM